MLLSLSLLKKFVDTDLSPAEISDVLTNLGLEIDSIINEKPSFSGVVVGKIKSATKHPEADNLNLLTVFDGTEEHQIICGDRSTKAGMRVALARIGAVLNDAKGSFTIKKAKLRGVESFGMLCTANELGLFEEADNVLSLDDSFEEGADIAKLLSDPIFEISLTPNLGHCQSALGVARELAAALNVPLKAPRIEIADQDSSLDISVEAEECARYSAKKVTGIEVKDSPFWLKKKLEESGIRSINAVIDITNYISLLFGQPMHAFDFDMIEGKKISVKLTEKKGPFLCLDDKERVLPEGALVICDAKNPIAIAGIMGGKNSAVTEKTQNVLLESAYFDSKAVRRTSSKIALRTESSMRFEKGIDPNFTPLALEYAAKLLVEICGGTAHAKSFDHKTSEFSPRKIKCRKERTNQILGTNLSGSEIESICKRLGFSVRSETVTVPFYRHDIHAEIDLIEEVARIYGYNNIEKTPAHYTSSDLPHNEVFLFEREIRKRCISMGLTEWLTPDLISPALASITAELSLQKKDMAKVLHAKSEDHSILRASLLPSLLQTIKHNTSHRTSDMQAFEIGRIHFLKESACIEQTVLGIVMTGKSSQHHWGEKPADVDFFDLKGHLENLFHSQRLEKSAYNKSDHPSFHTLRQADILIKELDIGAIGEIHPAILEKFDIKQRVLYAEVNLSSLLKLIKHGPKMEALPVYPSSERDWTVSLKDDLSFSEIEKALSSINSKLLEKASLLDVFTSEKLGDSKNVTLRFIYRDSQKTLSYDEVEKEHQKLTFQIEQKLS